jgi:ATP-dependent Clp protease ATP-binding subunit ClpA
VGFEQAGLLTDSISRHPFSVLLLDEIEKAHPDIFNILLQIMDYATLTDNNGKKADFRHVILLMTSNAGAREMASSSIGFGGSSVEVAAHKGMRAVEKLFSPEFRNRLDEIVMFNALSSQVTEQIVDKFMQEIQGQVAAKKVTVSLSDDARAWIARNGFSTEYGARPLARLLQEQLKNPLSDELLFGRLRGGGTVNIDLDRQAPAELKKGSSQQCLTFSFE